MDASEAEAVKKAQQFWAARGRALSDVFASNVERHALKSFGEPASGAYKMLEDGADTVGGGKRRAHLAFNASDRSAVIWIADDVFYPDGFTADVDPRGHRDI